MSPSLALVADVVPVGKLAVAGVLLGWPGTVVADAGGDARYIGIGTIVTAVTAGLVALVGALADAIVKLRRAADGEPTEDEVRRARDVLERAEQPPTRRRPRKATT